MILKYISSCNKDGLEKYLTNMMLVHMNLSMTKQVHGIVEGGQQLAWHKSTKSLILPFGISQS